MNFRCWFIVLIVVCVSGRVLLERGICLTNCIPFDELNQSKCSLDTRKVEQCDDVLEQDLQYYTSMHLGVVAKCSSRCSTSGRNYNWCYTSNTDWDFCSPSKCDSSTHGYRCVTPCLKYEHYSCFAISSDNKSGFIDHCSPHPISYKFFTDIANSITKLPRPCGSDMKLTRPETGNSNIRTKGVEELARKYEDSLDTVRIKRTSSSPVTSYVKFHAPPSPGLDDVELTVVIRATLTPEHISFKYKNCFSTNIVQILKNLNSLSDDIFIYLLDCQVGGPKDDFNIVPATSYARNFGQNSFWSIVSDSIRNFLVRYQNSRVEWILTVAYGNLENTRRPTGFALSYRQYDENGRLVLDSGDVYFPNEPNKNGPDACVFINVF